MQGENATLQYVLLGAKDKFDIRSSGQIVVKANIDREEKNQYKFVVRAKRVTKIFDYCDPYMKNYLMIFYHLYRSQPKKL